MRWAKNKALENLFGLICLTSSYFHRKKQSRKIGLGCRDRHRVLNRNKLFRLGLNTTESVRSSSASPAPILAKEVIKRGNIPHQNRLCFSLLLSFAEAKESRGTNSWANKKKGGRGKIFLQWQYLSLTFSRNESPIALRHKRHNKNENNHHT